MDKKTILILLAIIAFGLFLRAIFFIHTGQPFYEPDVEYYASFMQQTIANHYMIPKLDALSGFPVHTRYGEKPGLIYMALVPYYVLNPILSLVQTMFFVQILFSIAGILIAYKFAYELSNGNKTSGLLGALFFATISASVFKSMLGEWRGESFVPTMLAGALLLLLMAYKAKSKSKKAVYVILSILIMVAVHFTWTGAVYAEIAFIFAILLLGYYWLLKRQLGKWWLGRYQKYTLMIVFITATIFIAVAWLLFTNLTLPITQSINFSSVTQYGSYFGTNPPAIVKTTSELQPPSFLFWVTNYLLAFFLMWLTIVVLWFRDRKPEQTIAYLFMLSILLVGIPLSMSQVRWGVILAMPVCVFAALFIQLLYTYKDKYQISEKKIMQLFIVIIVISIAIPIYQWYPLRPIVNASPQYELTLLWIRNNTPSNATFLTAWSDGSAIEEVAQRQSYTDTVGGELLPRIINYSVFLSEPAKNFSYLNRIHPDYLLTRRYMLYESNTLAASGNLAFTYNWSGSNFELLYNQTPNQTSSSNGSITLKKVYQRNNDTVYEVEYNQTK